MKRSIATLLLVIGLVLPAFSQPTIESTSHSILFMALLDKKTGKALSVGTGFIVSQDGKALTVSHVALPAFKQPDKYVLTAIVDREMYDVGVRCSSKLPYDPTRGNHSVFIGKDIAEIQLRPFSDSRFSHYYVPGPNKEKVTIATAHTGPLPEFQPLSLGEMKGGHLYVVGFGWTGFIPTPLVWEGSLTSLPIRFNKEDSTSVFAISFNGKAAIPGDSGAPVLNEDGQVVGIYAWSFTGYRDGIGAAENLPLTCQPPI